ncbi:hypothetical protein [Spirosoma montaniterrae]|uniref:Outer membrane protein beta-barrel domain-containing protein n=1 Tax=Spirosoma montaniterrae TaxID=1178516 RepID=A0A1P9X2V2_9BACT|nr:hypothetical protein [Spirosoma montaniterrae]AQG81941.1 hypothetical protein AWR27_23175 [Spirosoma montaniterrae]
MKKLILTVLAAGMTTVSFSQKAFILSRQTKRGFLAASVGGSVPVGRFSSMSAADEQAGMAQHGLSLNASAGYKLIGSIGLMVRGEQHRNGLSTNAILGDIVRNDADVWVAQTGKYTITSVMAGPYIAVPMGLFSVDARLLAGRAQAILPATAQSGNFGNLSMGVETTGGTSMATSWGGGLTLRYRAGRSIAFHVNADYTHAQFEFTNLTTKVWDGNGRVQTNIVNATRPVGLVSVSGGLSLLFGNQHRPF